MRLKLCIKFKRVVFHNLKESPLYCDEKFLSFQLLTSLSIPSGFYNRTVAPSLGGNFEDAARTSHLT
jgi:hypothetical protein